MPLYQSKIETKVYNIMLLNFSFHLHFKILTKAPENLSSQNWVRVFNIFVRFGHHFLNCMVINKIRKLSIKKIDIEEIYTTLIEEPITTIVC